MRRDTPAVALAGLLFFLSGRRPRLPGRLAEAARAAQRVGLYSVAMIVAAFMAGLGSAATSAGASPRASGAGGPSPPSPRWSSASPPSARRARGSITTGSTLGPSTCRRRLAGGAAPSRRAPAADHAHGDVAALPRPGGRDRRRGRGTTHRLAVRRQHTRSGGRRLRHAVGPAARARPPWRGARRRLGQPRRRSGGSRPLHPARAGRHAPAAATEPAAALPASRRRAAGRFRSGCRSTRSPASLRCRWRSSGSASWTWR